ncbi:hypothetical protein EMMF5_005281 [Cystobasidiomycetes sp. EMM_F5]
MAPKRKSAETSGAEQAQAKVAKKSGKSADKVGLKYEQFQSTAPALQATITAKSKNGSEVKEVLQVELTKQKMSTGSYGWSSAGKRINLEIELEDGTKETIQAQLSLNITILGSKAAEESSNSKRSTNE